VSGAAKPLDGRVAVVTGASRGIGKGCALELGAAGATVYVTGRTLEEGGAPLPGTIGATAAEVTAAGGRGIAVQCDHGRDEDVAALFARVREEAGGLDVLVNNAFLIPRELTSGKPFFETPISNWDDMVGVGTRSAYVATHFAVPLLRARGGGLVANISSSGAAEYAWHVAYGVGKAALDRFTADAARELAPLGIAVVSLWPGLVLTERTSRAKEALPTLDFAGAESQRFTGRAVVALASDPKRMERSGRAWPSRDLADAYGFTDVDGTLPKGPLHDRPSASRPR
jgi:NAD(P)-dependent dehydrogenase (short-subunit alcohol dehydrogenase family)